MVSLSSFPLCFPSLCLSPNPSFLSSSSSKLFDFCTPLSLFSFHSSLSHSLSFIFSAHACHGTQENLPRSMEKSFLHSSNLRPSNHQHFLDSFFACICHITDLSPSLSRFHLPLRLYIVFHSLILFPTTLFLTFSSFPSLLFFIHLKMAEELLSFCMALGAYDPPRFLSTYAREVSQRQANQSLVVQRLHPSQDLMGLKEHLTSLWKLEGRGSIIIQQNGTLQVFFESESHLLNVIEDAPWTFKGWLLAIDLWSNSHSPTFLQEVTL